NASRSRSEKRRHKQWIDHRDIDGLHGGDALRRREAGKGIHYEGRKSEEDPGHQPAAERREKGQSEEHSVDHLKLPTLDRYHSLFSIRHFPFLGLKKTPLFLPENGKYGMENGSIFILYLHGLQTTHFEPILSV